VVSDPNIYVLAFLAFSVCSNPIDLTTTAPPSLVHIPRDNPGPSLGSDFWGYASENWICEHLTHALFREEFPSDDNQ
jgi:hypothetical protein